MKTPPDGRRFQPVLGLPRHEPEAAFIYSWRLKRQTIGVLAVVCLHQIGPLRTCRLAVCVFHRSGRCLNTIEQLGP